MDIKRLVIFFVFIIVNGQPKPTAMKVSKKLTNAYLEAFILYNVTKVKYETPGAFERFCSRWCLASPGCNAFNVRPSLQSCQLMALGYWKVSGLVNETGASHWAV